MMNSWIWTSVVGALALLALSCSTEVETADDGGGHGAGAGLPFDPEDNPAGCPDSELAIGTSCHFDDTNNVNCFYQHEGCLSQVTCNMGEWFWVGTLGICSNCPEAPPEHGSPCDEPYIWCSYDIDIGCGPQLQLASCEDESWDVEPVACP